MEKHLDIIEQAGTSKAAKNYFWPIPFGFPMYDPYNTGPMSEPILSPAGGFVAPRRNPYYPKPINPFLSPYSTQFRMAMSPYYNSFPSGRPMGRPPGPPPGGRPPGPPPGGGIGGPPPGPPPMGPPPMGGPRPF